MPDGRSEGTGEVLASLLDSTGQIVSSVLRGEEGRGAYSALASIAAARTLAEVSEDILRDVVERARRSGHTWQEIGDVLRVTRQAAQKRFGGHWESRLGRASEEGVMQEAATKAVQLVGDQVNERWDGIVEAFNAEMASKLTPAMLESGWAQVRQMVGDYRDCGEPVVRDMAGHIVVDVPLHFERGEMKSRVAFDDEGKVAGLFVLRPEVI